VGEQLLQQPPVLDGEHLPARGVEHALQAGGADVGDDPVEALPVEVDDPDDLAELGHHRVEDRLPAGALVQLRVADEGVLPARTRCVVELGDVPARERPPDQGGGADADRAGGVVDGIGVLRAARVALQPAERAQGLQVLLVELAEQVVDRVQDGRGVRLDRYPVLAAQVLEPQRRHDRHQRGARRLVPADLQPAGVGAHPVGVVHDRRGQPEHSLLDDPQGLVVHRDLQVARQLHHRDDERTTVDATDARLLLALSESPRAGARNGGYDLHEGCIATVRRSWRCS